MLNLAFINEINRLSLSLFQGEGKNSNLVGGNKSWHAVDRACKKKEEEVVHRLGKQEIMV